MKSLHRMFGRAIRRLQRDAAVRERRADLHDRAAVARLHPPQRRERSPHVAEVRDLGDAPIVGGGHLHDRRENGEHGVVDPDVDRSERALDFVRGLFDRVFIGNVKRQHDRLAAEFLDLAFRAFQSVFAAGDQSDFRAAFPERTRGRASHARGRASDDDDFR